MSFFSPSSDELPGMPSSFSPVEVSRVPSLPPVPRHQLPPRPVPAAPRLPQELEAPPATLRSIYQSQQAQSYAPGDTVPASE